jgi:hypothetical protein
MQKGPWENEPEGIKMTPIDTNQAAIAKFLRSNGAKVDSTTKMGGGFPDLLVTYRGLVAVVEVKQPGRKLRPDQVKWHNLRPGMVFIIHSEDEAGTLLRMIDELMTFLRACALSSENEDGRFPALGEILLQSEVAYDHRPRRKARSR